MGAKFSRLDQWFASQPAKPDFCNFCLHDCMNIQWAFNEHSMSILLESNSASLISDAHCGQQNQTFCDFCLHVWMSIRWAFDEHFIKNQIQPFWSVMRIAASKTKLFAIFAWTIGRAFDEEEWAFYARLTRFNCDDRRCVNSQRWWW